MKQDATDSLTLGELSADPSRVLGTEASDSTLHYCSPAHGGWGVVRAALLVPESYLLFACPAACGRHGAIAAIEQGFKDRVGYLCLTENEIVLGGYEDEIIAGVRETIKRIRPKALLLCVSCIDDLLGTDHEASLAEMEREHRIPVRLARMNPISLDGKLPPAQRIQRSMYEFLKPSMGVKELSQRDVLILGSFVPPSKDSELAKVVQKAGFRDIAHPSFCDTFENFSNLSECAFALLLRPEGGAAAEYLEREFSIPVSRVHIGYSEKRILRNYDRLFRDLEANGGTALGHPATVFSAEIEEYRSQARGIGKLLGRRRIALDATSTCSPFDLALALCEAGCNVTAVYAEKIAPHDKESFDALCQLSPGIQVSNPAHSRRASGLPKEATADIAIGFSAGYASSAPMLVPISFDEGRYGFQGFLSVLEEVERVITRSDSSPGEGLKEKIKEYGLVV